MFLLVSVQMKLEFFFFLFFLKQAKFQFFRFLSKELKPDTLEGELPDCTTTLRPNYHEHTQPVGHSPDGCCLQDAAQ